VNVALLLAAFELTKLYGQRLRRTETESQENVVEL
jgi:hypothetical protein